MLTHKSWTLESDDCAYDQCLTWCLHAWRYKAHRAPPSPFPVSELGQCSKGPSLGADRWLAPLWSCPARGPPIPCPTKERPIRRSAYSLRQVGGQPALPHHGPVSLINSLQIYASKAASCLADHLNSRSALIFQRAPTHRPGKSADRPEAACIDLSWQAEPSGQLPPTQSENNFRLPRILRALPYQFDWPVERIYDQRQQASTRM